MAATTRATGTIYIRSEVTNESYTFLALNLLFAASWIEHNGIWAIDYYWLA
jgi:hypothetical protein